MKTQAYFVMLWLLHAVAWAQSFTPQSFAPSFSYRISSDYQDDLDSRFAALDKSQISTGVLYSRVYPAAQLLTFNQNGQQDVSSAGHFRQAYWELYNSLYNKGSWPSPPDFDDLLKDYTFQNKVLLGVISQDINYFKDDALSNNLLNIQNGQLYDTPNRSTSPYGTVRTFVAAALMDKIKTGPVTFEFPNWLFFSNHSSTLQRLEVDFGEAGVRTFYPGNSHTVAFNTSGAKTLRLTAYFLNGVVQTTFSTLNVEASNAGGATPCMIRRVIAEQGFSGYIYEEGQNVPNQGDAGYYFASVSSSDAGRDCGRTNVRKPVIILDGFDPTDDRLIEDIYDTKLVYGSRNIIEDDLISDNYDAVILNFPNDVEIGIKYVNFPGISIPIKVYRGAGADYVQRNAFVLVKLIKELNQQMQAEGSNEKITIIGPSMGGLISRYALAWMEKNGQTHNCKLWASFDAPHHGANIMLGDQLLLDYLANGLGVGSAKKSVREQLDSPAARQMLISHYRGYNSSSLAPGGALEFRDRFVTEMNDIGFPTNSCLRKIALINGSKNGTMTFPSCGNSFKLQTGLTTFGTGVVSTIFGVASLFAQLKADVYTEPNNASTCKVLEREFTFGTLYKKWEVSNSSFRQTSLDILPGGYYDVSGDIADQGRAKNWFYQIQFQNFFPKASFIPSVSGLALKNINRNWAENLSNINVIADTPFDAIYAPINENQNHVSLTSENVQFVKDQLNLANQQCNTGGGSTCSNTGSISYQRWENIGGGTSIQDLRNNTNNLNNSPSHTQTLNSFEAPLNILDNYGVRIRGYVCPPTTGNYTFWVAGDDNAELWISGNDQPTNLSRIAYHTAWTPSLEWGWFSTQQSAPVTLQAGQRYYVEALMKEGAGGDNLAVGWQLPNGALERPIPGNRLIPFEGGSGSNCNFSVSPSSSNPSPSCGANISLNANCSGSDCGSVNYSWSGNGLSGSNSSVTTNVPSSNGTFTYTITASKSGCNNQSGNVNVTVSGCGTLNQCIEAESSSGTGAVTSDPNASNGQTRGEENDYNHYVDYVVTNVPSAGTYYVKLRYYSSSAPAIGVQVNGGGGGNFSLPSSGSWNIVWTEYTFTVSLSSGTNTIRIQGTGGGSCRQDRICVSSNPPRLGVAGEKEALGEDTQTLQLYPNPTDGKVTVRYYLEKGQKASLQFINTKGHVLLQKGLVGEGGWGQNQTDLSAQPDGVYVVRMETPEKTVSRKFMIAK